MKNGAFIVFKKELARFFGDKRLFFTSVIMPGLMIYLLYTLMGNGMTAMINDKTSSFKAAAVNMPQAVAEQLEEYSFSISDADPADLEKTKERITSGDLAVYIYFPDDFEDILTSYGTEHSADSTPNVEIYYNSADINSAHAYSQVVSVLDTLEKQVSNVFDINNTADSEESTYDLATDEETTGSFLSLILPMLLITLMYSSCVALAPESIAGEKERGTIAALLITPTPRSQIIMGKVGALSLMALLGGLSSFLGTLLSIPTLMQSAGEDAGAIDTAVYGMTDYLWLIALILSTVLLFITVISLLSTLAKSVKEAGTMVMPLMLVVLMMSLTSMYGSGAHAELYWYLIPIYNTIQGMTEIFSFTTSAVHLVVTICVNIAVSLAGMFVLTKLFDNENVMFGKS